MARHVVYLAGLLAVGVRVGIRLADRGQPPRARRLVRAGVPVVVLAAVPQVLTVGGGS